MCSGKPCNIQVTSHFVKINRASYFSYISSVTYVVNFSGPTLAAFTMSRSVWLPIWLGIVLLLLAVPTIGMLPEVRKSGLQPATETENEEVGPLLADQSSSPSRYASAFQSPTTPYHTMLQAIRKLLHLITGRRNFQILLTSFFLTALASSDTRLLVQYISKRYKWTFSEVMLFSLYLCAR